VPVPVLDGVADELIVGDALDVGLLLGVIALDGVPLAEPPEESVLVGVALDVDEIDAVVDSQSEPVDVPVGVHDAVPVPVWLDEGVPVPVLLVEAVCDADAPSVTLEVGVAVTEGVCEEETLDVPDALGDGVKVGDGDGVASVLGNGDSAPVSVGDPLALSAMALAVTLAVALGTVPARKVLVGDVVTVGVALSEVAPLCAPLSVPLGVRLCVGVGAPDPVTLALRDGAVPGERVLVTDDAVLGVAELVGVGVGVAELVGVTDGDDVSVSVELGVCELVGDGVTTAVRVALRVGLAVALDVAVPLTVPLRDEVLVGLPLALAPGERLAVGDGVGVLVALGGHTARRTLGPPPSAMRMLRVAASHAMPCGAVNDAPVPEPSATPTPRPPTIVLTAPVSACTARISAFPASATST
jgi:hypothetical protein